MSKIAIFLAEGFEEIEALTVVDLVRRAGMDIKMVSITGERIVTSSRKVQVVADVLFQDVDFDEIDMLVLPGGMPGTINLEAYAPLMKKVEEFHATKKCISAICAAPRILGHRGMLAGRNACCFPEYEGELQDANVTRKEVEVSEHIITARGMGCTIPFALAIVAHFAGQEKAKELSEKIIYSHL